LRSTRIRIEVVGEVPEGFVRLVEETLRKFYGRIGGPPLVEVYIYASRAHKLAQIEELASRYGVAVVGDFITMHEAWSGWPRIHVDYEQCSKLDGRYVEALLIHEAAHSVLHGSLIYYVVDVPPEVYNDPIEMALIYSASTIVKDMGVCGLLAESGLKEYIEAYSDFVSEHQLEDKCSDLFEVFMLAKLLVPCLYLERCSPADKLRNCRGVAARLLEALSAVRNLIRGLDFSAAVLEVKNRLEDVVRRSFGNAET